MNRKGNLALMSILTMAAMSPDNMRSMRQEVPPIKSGGNNAPKKRIVTAGMKEWTIDGKTVFAVTKRAAIKKAGKIK